MAKQTLNLGTAPSGQGGDTPRSANVKIGANFDELYTAMGATGNPQALPAALPVSKGGTGGTTPATARSGLELKSAALADVLGIVAQTSGYPTGAVMEWGYNANGEYYKFASGLMICTATRNVTVAVNTNYGGGSFGGANWDFPATFVGTLPFVSGKAFATGRIMTVEPAAAQQLYSSALWVLDFATNGTSMSVLLKMFAVGRWF
ncbi:putative structural protein [uncultured Caudovirales phage]|uniref:Putative structural protein n=1 Tax=uncultured Caudovirales phage TaxID=2100421 RepID=A0A2H4J2B7_9CAUD|nr:hypothetical protein 3S4_31 [uncultured Caudovirales phage]ASN68388.1 putative structural protein [uncultured Caudovirales phage]ASN68440.1 putative structural protein [uncultured Caudovirales phage]ASN68559.1 putative structural protein [uncultured Caudovirales phage]ASN72081.1 putative structural protein [uncultured Caudovirales phage]